MKFVIPSAARSERDGKSRKLLSLAVLRASRLAKFVIPSAVRSECDGQSRNLLCLAVRLV